MSLTKAQVREMHRLYTEELWPLKAVGEKYGVSRETARKQFQQYGLAVRPRGTQPSAIRNLERARERHDSIIKYYQTVGSVTEVAEYFELPPVYVQEIVSPLASREMYKRRGMRVRYENEDLLEALRRAADILGEPLSVYKYQKAAAALGLPSHMTIIKRFDSWVEACNLAGVEVSEGYGSRVNSFTKDDCITAMRSCRDEIGRKPTYERYDEWSREGERRPSGPTVRVKWKKWSSAYKEAFEE